MMDKQLEAYVRSLSDTDKKNALERFAKLGEEFGELARALLPYFDCGATRHRFSTKEQICEELVDVSLCVLSLLFHKDIDLTMEDFYRMMRKKADKWGGLQAAEMGLADKLPYEIHISVGAKRFLIPKSGSIQEEKRSVLNWTEADIQDYRADCASIGVKPIVLDLELNDGASMKDVMTSSKVFGSAKDAAQEIDRIVRAFGELGYEVVREKLETVPWHPAAPSIKRNRLGMPKDCYFEAHFGVKVRVEHLEDLRTHLSRAPGGHLHTSRNVFKKVGEEVVLMATLRDSAADALQEPFEEDVNKIAEHIRRDPRFSLEKPIVEFSLYDTKVGHDRVWIASATNSTP